MISEYNWIQLNTTKNVNEKLTNLGLFFTYFTEFANSHRRNFFLQIFIFILCSSIEFETYFIMRQWNYFFEQL